MEAPMRCKWSSWLELLLLYGLLFWCAATERQTTTTTTTIQTPSFACVTLDWWPATKCDFDHCTWNNSALWAVNLEELKPYARVLSPFVLRLGGSLQDYVDYRPNGCDYASPNQFPVNASMPQRFGHGCIDQTKLLKIFDFCHDVGCQIVWGLNGMHGRSLDGQGAWNSTNSRQLLEFFHQHKAPLLGVTLGNEIWAIKVNLTVQQAFDTYAELDSILSSIWTTTPRPLIAGFDGNGWSLKFPFYQELLPKLATNNIRLDVLNYHDYPLGSSDDEDVVNKALSYQAYQKARDLAEQAHATAKLYSNNLTVWVSESGGSYDSGSLAATGSYGSGFWYLSNLAATHAAGNAHFCRQTLTGGFYGLTTFDNPKRPHPDFWNTVLYNRLMGPPTGLTVNSLGRSTSDDQESPSVQWTIHCSKRHHPTSVAILALNYDRYRTHEVQLATWKYPILAYRLTPAGGTNATNANATSLNGQVLEFQPDGSLPELNGELLKNTNVLTVAPLTYAFFEIIGFYSGSSSNPCAGDGTSGAATYA